MAGAVKWEWRTGGVCYSDKGHQVHVRAMGDGSVVVIAYAPGGINSTGGRPVPPTLYHERLEAPEQAEVNAAGRRAVAACQ